jgi:protein O-mannosyl-transferase
MPVYVSEKEPPASLPVAHASLPPASTRRFLLKTSQPFIPGLLLILASLALYNSVGSHPFINYDDDRYISDNAHVKFGLSWESVKWAFTGYDESNWHPVTWLSHMLDCNLFQLNPAGHHYMNALLHALNVALLFWLLYSATGFIWRSFMAAALFGLHPINVESVAWVAERKNLLSLFFFLLALLAYGWYASKPGIKRYAVVALVFALGLMAKPQVITLPFVLLLWDYWPLHRAGSPLCESDFSTGPRVERRTWRSLVLEKLPLFAMCVPSAFLTFEAQNAAGAVTSFARYSLQVRVANALVSYAQYLGKALWPSHLCVLYPYQPASLTKSQIFLSVFLLLLITGGVFSSKKGYFQVGWFWFLGTLVPMIGIVQVGVQSMADRYAYLPFIGLFFAVCWGVADLVRNDVASRRSAIAASCLTLSLLAIVSHRQIGYWSSSLALWSHTASLTTHNYVAEDGIANALLAEGDLEDAMPHYQAAAAIHPSDPISNLNLAFYKSLHGDSAGALAQYKTVSKTTVDERSRATAFINMGLINQKLGNLASARDNLQAGVNLRPRNVRGWVSLGAVTQRLGDYDSAIRAYSRAVQLQPSDVTYFLLAQGLKKAGRDDEAALAGKMAERLSENISQTEEFANSLINP